MNATNCVLPVDAPEPLKTIDISANACANSVFNSLVNIWVLFLTKYTQMGGCPAPLSQEEFSVLFSTCFKATNAIFGVLGSERPVTDMIQAMASNTAAAEQQPARRMTTRRACPTASQEETPFSSSFISQMMDPYVDESGANGPIPLIACAFNLLSVLDEMVNNLTESLTAIRDITNSVEAQFMITPHDCWRLTNIHGYIRGVLVEFCRVYNQLNTQLHFIHSLNTLHTLSSFTPGSGCGDMGALPDQDNDMTAAMLYLQPQEPAQPEPQQVCTMPSCDAKASFDDFLLNLGLDDLMMSSAYEINPQTVPGAMDGFGMDDSFAVPSWDYATDKSFAQYQDFSCLSAPNA